MIFDVVTNKLFKDLLAGTVPAGDSKKLNGLTAEEFVSNDNLLINSDFKNPVNSSGKTSWSGVDVALFDGWKTYSAQLNAISLIDSGVKIANTWQATGNKTTFGTATSIKLKAGTYTLSMNIVEKVGTWFAQFHKHYQLKDGVNTITTTFDTDTEVSLFFFKNSAEADAYIVLEYIKLERGSVATPFIPPNKEVEKLKCGVANADTVDNYHASDLVRKFQGWGREFFGSANINTWVSDGVYAYQGGDTNQPHGDWGTIQVLAPLKSDRVTQIGYDWNEAYQPYRARYSNDGGANWSEWDYLNSSVLAKYLPLDGSVPMSGVLKLGNDTQILLAELHGGGEGGYIDFFSEGNRVGGITVNKNGNFVFYDTEARTVLHTGNSKKVTITDSADTPPAEMSGLWAY